MGLATVRADPAEPFTVTHSAHTARSRRGCRLMRARCALVARPASVHACAVFFPAIVPGYSFQRTANFYHFFFFCESDQVIRENPASRGTETSAEVLVGPPGRME